MVRLGELAVHRERHRFVMEDLVVDLRTAVMGEQLTEMVLDERVRLTSDVSDRDQFDRLLRYIWLEDGTFVNEVMVAGRLRFGSGLSPRHRI